MTDSDSVPAPNMPPPTEGVASQLQPPTASNGANTSPDDTHTPQPLSGESAASSTLSSPSVDETTLHQSPSNTTIDLLEEAFARYDTQMLRSERRIEVLKPQLQALVLGLRQANRDRQAELDRIAAIEADVAKYKADLAKNNELLASFDTLLAAATSEDEASGYQTGQNLTECTHSGEQQVSCEGCKLLQWIASTRIRVRCIEGIIQHLRAKQLKATQMQLWQWLIRSQLYNAKIAALGKALDELEENIEECKTASAEVAALSK